MYFGIETGIMGLMIISYIEGPTFLSLVFDKSPFDRPGEYRQVSSSSAKVFRFWRYIAAVDS